MIKRGFVLLLALVGCGPNFQSGKTKCSDNLECPSGYVCGAEQQSGTAVCFDDSLAPCAGATPFFCQKTNTCVASLSSCGVVDSQCSDVDHPVYCPPQNGTQGGCWDKNTDCSSLTTCGGSAIACAFGEKLFCQSGSGHCAAPCLTTKWQALWCEGPDGQLCKKPDAGGACNVPNCGCPSGQVCYPNTKATGLSCYNSDGLTEGADCSKGMCAAGLGCFGNTCKRYCQTVKDCTAVDGAQDCVTAIWSEDETAISGVSVCERVCDPVSPQNPRAPLLACPAGFGCDSDDANPGVSGCFKQPGTLPAGSSCTDSEECLVGHYCSTGKVCIKFCATAADCPAGVKCNFFTTPQYAGKTQIGYCK